MWMKTIASVHEGEPGGSGRSERLAPRRSVTFAVPDFDPSVGGTTRQTRLQAEALVRRGHRVVIVTRRLRGDWSAREAIDGLDVVRLGRPPFDERGVLVALSAWLARRRREIDIVQTVMWPDAVLAAAAAGLVSRSALLWAIDGEIAAALRAGGGPHRKLLSALRRRAFARAEHVVLTQRMASELTSLAPELSHCVIPVPIDRDHFRPPTAAERRDSRAQLGIAPDAFTVVYVGHLQRRKAVDTLISAFAALRRTVAGSHLLLVGGGRGRADDTADELRRQVLDLELEGSVTLCGIVPDPLRHLWAADVLALTSEREGLPNSLLEAMACGIPWVAPAAAGGDVLPADTGVVPSTNDPAAVADALLQLADPDRRLTLGDTARRESERYDVERIADDYEDLYTRIGNRR
jgi:glycosyltransferase involved in cell wall biosynthesis